MTIPKPGAYDNVPFDTYLTWDAVSNSKLNSFQISPAHCRTRDDNKSDAKKFGSAVHSAILEPRIFREKYAVRDASMSGNSKAAITRKQELINRYGEDFILTEKEASAILSIQTAARGHSVAGPLLRSITKVELSIVWEQEGVLCKGRIDGLTPSVIVDIKTTKSAEPRAFATSFFRYGYHRQAAHYIAGCRTLGITAPRVIFIAVEKYPPYGVCVYEPSHKVLARATAELTELIRAYGECYKKNHWPSYPESIQTIELPTWMTDEDKETFTPIEEETTNEQQPY